MSILTNGPDPVDGLRLALLQQRAGQLRARLGVRSFGMMEALLLLMLACGIALLVSGERSLAPRAQYFVLGWALIAQAIGLWWSARRSARKELQQLEKKMSAVVHAHDGEVVAAAATSARSLLLRKP